VLIRHLVVAELPTHDGRARGPNQAGTSTNRREEWRGHLTIESRTNAVESSTGARESRTHAQRVARLAPCIAPRPAAHGSQLRPTHSSPVCCKYRSPPEPCAARRSAPRVAHCRNHAPLTTRPMHGTPLHPTRRSPSEPRAARRSTPRTTLRSTPRAAHRHRGLCRTELRKRGR